MIKNMKNNGFYEIYNKYGPLVLRRCRALLKDEDLARQAAQAVIIHIMDSPIQIKELCAGLFYDMATIICYEKSVNGKLGTKSFEKDSFTA